MNNIHKSDVEVREIWLGLVLQFTYLNYIATLWAEILYEVQCTSLLYAT